MRTNQLFIKVALNDSSILFLCNNVLVIICKFLRKSKWQLLKYMCLRTILKISPKKETQKNWVYERIKLVFISIHIAKM